MVTRLLPRSTASNTCKLRAKLAWCAVFLATVISPTIVLAVPTRCAVRSLTTTTGACMGRAGTNGLAMSLWDDLCGEMKPFAEILTALRREGVVIPLPRELGLNVTTGG